MNLQGSEFAEVGLLMSHQVRQMQGEGVAFLEAIVPKVAQIHQRK